MTTVETRETYAKKRAARRASERTPRPMHRRRVRRLFVVRESSAYKWALFGAMMKQVLERHRHLPSVERILDAGVDLVRPGPAGDRLRSEFEVVELRARRRGRGRRGRVEAYVFIVGEDAFMLSQMSASRAEADGLNKFGGLLVDQVHTLRPEEMHTGRIARFGRSTEVFSRVGTAVKTVGCRVFSDEADGWDLTNPSDWLRWEMYGLIAGAELREILKRLTIGRLVEAKSGKWPLGTRQIVLGYEVGKDKTPAPSSDPRVRAWVRELIELGADERLSLDDIADRLSRSGLTTPKLQDIYGGDGSHDPSGEESLLGAAVRPWEGGGRLYGHLETYLTGQYRFELTCPMPGVTDWYSTPVERTEDDPFGAFRVTIPLGLPPGGWADEETIRRAIKLRCAPRQPRPTGAASHSTDHKPFSGFRPWVVGDVEHVLSSKRTSYQILSRPTAHAGSGWREGGSTVLAAINASSFHSSFAERVLQTLDDVGFDASSVTFASRAVAGDEGRMEKAQKWRLSIAELEQTNAGLAASIGLARAEGREDKARLYETVLEGNLNRIAQLQASLERAASRPEPVPSVADVTALPELLRLLSLGQNQYAAIVSERLHQMVEDLRFDVNPFQVTWSCAVRVPTDEGIMRVPVTGALPNVARARGGAKERLEAERAEYLRALWVDEGLTLEEIAARVGWSDVDSVERRLRRQVLDLWPVTPAMRHALMDCPLPEVRRVLARYAEGQPPETPWEALVISSYTATTSWAEAWSADDLGDRQRVIDALVARGDLDAGCSVEVLAEACGVPVRRLAEAMAGDPDDRGGRLRAPLFGRVLDREAWTPATPAADRRVRVRCCPFCRTRTVTLVRRVPETGTSPVLCSTCLRRPDDPDGVIFPEAYRTVPCRPRRPWRLGKAAVEGSGRSGPPE